MKHLVKRAIRGLAGVGGSDGSSSSRWAERLESGCADPRILNLLWASHRGFCFLIGHALYVRYWVKPQPEDPAAAARVALIGPSIAETRRPSLAWRPRVFRLDMAASMLVLLFTSVSADRGIRFAVGDNHWIAARRCSRLSVLSHAPCVDSGFNFWSIWPTLSDLDAHRSRVR